MGTDDKLRNEFDDRKGAAKVWVGEHTDDAEMANRGRAEQAGAKTRKAGEHIKDAARDAGDRVRDAAEDAKDAVRRRS
jgi:uncharacterized protein YjbJ (UPF0337 family)